MALATMGARGVMSDPFYIVKPERLTCDFATETGKPPVEEGFCANYITLGKKIYEGNGYRCSINSSVYLASPRSITTISLICESELNLFSRLWAHLPDSNMVKYQQDVLSELFRGPIAGLQVLLDAAKPPPLPKLPSREGNPFSDD
jgi:hypothetical protein